MIRHLASVAILGFVALAAGCGSSPPSHFYTLSASAKPTAGASGLSIAVGPVSVPAMVDRPEIVVTTGPNEVRLDEFNRWASPLQDNLSRVVAENLAAILGTPRVSLFPQTLNTATDYRVGIEVQRFESTPNKAAVLDAVWTVLRSKDGKSQTGRTEVTEKVQSTNYDELAAAHSRAVARLSQDIAEAIRTLQESASQLGTDKTANP
jgi:uncharacterized protein